ncbi:hypothetical protein E4U35_008003, partial [Claviceps purpurea]
PSSSATNTPTFEALKRSVVDVRFRNAYAGEAHHPTSLLRVCRRGPDLTRTDEADDQKQSSYSLWQPFTVFQFRTLSRRATVPREEMPRHEFRQ